MAYEDFLHGVEVIDIEGGPRPIETRRSSILGLIGTAPDADATEFPINTPVALFGREISKIAKLGSNGTLPWALDSIHDQFAPVVVVIRIHRAPSTRVSVLRSLTRPIIKVEAEDVTRGSGDTDALANTELVGIDSITMGSTTYERNVAWERDGDLIRWKRDSIVETIIRRASTVDPLDHQDDLLQVTKVFQDETIFVDGTDYQVHDGTNGIEWLDGGNAPDERTNYYVQYEYGIRPAEDNVYEVTYSYYDNAYVDAEDVVRDGDTTGTEYDPLANYDILTVSAVTQGAKTWVEDTDWELANDKIHWLSDSIVEDVTRNADVAGTPTYGGMNVGNGTIGTITVSNESEIGDYSIVCTDDTTPGSEVWSVTSPEGTSIGPATTGVAFTSTQANFTISAGVIDWAVDDTITLPVSAVVDTLVHSDILLNVPTDGVYQNIDIYTKDVDYEITLDGEVQWLTNNRPIGASTYNVNYSYGDRPAVGTTYEVSYSHQIGELVAMNNVIGGINIDNGLYEGVHAFKAAEDVLKLKPKLLIAPGFTNHVAVTTEMLGIAETLKAVVIADGPNTNDETAVNWGYNYDSKRLYIVDPWHKFWNTYLSEEDQRPNSAITASLFAKRDKERGVWWSPSNQVINGILGNSRPVGFEIDDPNSRSNYLNYHDIATVISDSGGGYKLWGNHARCSDQRYRFITSTRVNDMIAEALIYGLTWAVDRNMGRTFFSEVAESVNAYIRRLSSQGAIILGPTPPCYVVPADNPADGLALGKARFKFEYANVPPAEHITLEREIKQEYLTEIFNEADFLGS